MKKLIFNLSFLVITSSVFSQMGTVTLEEEIIMTTMPLKHVADDLKNNRGFTIVEWEITSGSLDSAVYMSFNNTDGLGNDLRYSRKINGTEVSSGFSFTSTSDKWYNNEIAKISGLGFRLTDNVLKSETAHEAKIYEKDNVRIQTFWSVYPGMETKFYTIDVIRF